MATLTEARTVANMIILQKLEEYIKSNPDIRFGQALWNLNIVQQETEPKSNHCWKDGYYEEPSITVIRMVGDK